MLRGKLQIQLSSAPLEVWVVDVPTLYALEVRVMRWECGSPRGDGQVAGVVEDLVEVG